MNTDIFDYEEIEVLSDKSGHSVILVRHGKTGKEGVKRRVGKDEYEIYEKIQSAENIHLPKIYAIFSGDGEYSVIEEKIDGTRLSDFIYDMNWDEETVLWVITQLCEGLAVFHERGIVHRDLKPENIMYSDGIFKIIDFNIARMHKEDAGHDTEYLGTPGYAAPEQFGFGQSDIQTDIYSLGVLMNVMLTGRFPNEEMYKGPLEGVIKKCIALSPDKRFQSVFYLVSELKGYTDLIYDKYREKADEYRSENDFYSIALSAAAVWGIISVFIHFCIDASWGMGVDFFIQTIQPYLASDTYTFKELFFAVPLTGWGKLVGMSLFLIWAARSIRDGNRFGVVFWVCFTVFDLHWQIGAFIHNKSLFAAELEVNWKDFLNVLQHIACLGVFIKIFCNMRQISRCADMCKDMEENKAAV